MIYDRKGNIAPVVEVQAAYCTRCGRPTFAGRFSCDHCIVQAQADRGRAQIAEYDRQDEARARKREMERRERQEREYAAQQQSQHSYTSYAPAAADDDEGPNQLVRAPDWHVGPPPEPAGSSSFDYSGWWRTFRRLFTIAWFLLIGVKLAIAVPYVFVMLAFLSKLWGLLGFLLAGPFRKGFLGD